MVMTTIEIDIYENEIKRIQNQDNYEGAYSSREEECRDLKETIALARKEWDRLGSKQEQVKLTGSDKQDWKYLQEAIPDWERRFKELGCK